MNAKSWRKVHAIATFVWALLIIPSLLWWSNSIKWVVLISVYANFSGHFAAWQGARAEDNGNDD